MLAVWKEGERTTRGENRVESDKECEPVVSVSIEPKAATLRGAKSDTAILEVDCHLGS